MQQHQEQAGAKERAQKPPLLVQKEASKQSAGGKQGSLTPGRRRELQASCTKNPSLTMQQVRSGPITLTKHTVKMHGARMCGLEKLVLGHMQVFTSFSHIVSTLTLSIGT